MAGFREADLTGADFSEATNLIKANLAGAKYDSRTIWPDVFDAEAAGAIRVT